MSRRLLYLLLIGVLARGFTPAEGAPPVEEPQNAPDLAVPAQEYASGVVLKVQKPVPVSPGASAALGSVEKVTVRVTSGAWTGREVILNNFLSGHPGYDVSVTPGARVLVSVETRPNQPPDINIADRERFPAIKLLMSLYLLALLLLGGAKGLRTLGVLALLGLILPQFIVMPLCEGVPPWQAALWFTGAFFCLGVVLLHPRETPGFNARCLTALAASVTTVAVTLALLGWVAQLAPIQGFMTEDWAALWQQYPKLRFQQVFLLASLITHGGILWAAVLLVLDRLVPVLQATPGPYRQRYGVAWQSGQGFFAPLSVGLLLLYTGLSFPLLFNGTPDPKFFNLESVTALMASALVGATGLLLAPAITAAYAALWILPRPGGKALSP